MPGNSFVFAVVPSSTRLKTASGDGDSAGLRTPASAAHRAGGDGVEEVERGREGEHEYALEGEEELEWYDDEKPTYTLHPFEAGMVMSEVELAHPPGFANSPAGLEPVTPVSPASPVSPDLASFCSFEVLTRCGSLQETLATPV